MEAIPQVIFNLLIQRRRVVLPGLGTLFVESSPARYDAPSQTVTAPVNRVCFTPAEEPGETLADIAARQSGIPPKEIRPQVNRWVAGIKKASDGGRITIDGAGVLVEGPEGAYRFEPVPELDRGLNPIDPKTIRIPELSSPKKRRGAGWIILLIVLTALAGGGYYLYTRGFFSPTPVPASAPQTPVLPEPATILPDSLPPADSAAVVPEHPVISETHTGELYHIIAGVFSTRENAERFVRENAFTPSRTELIPTAGGRFMVSIGKYAEKSEADKALETAQKSIPQAWVSKRNR